MGYPAHKNRGPKGRGGGFEMPYSNREDLDRFGITRYINIRVIRASETIKEPEQ